MTRALVVCAVGLLLATASVRAEEPTTTRITPYNVYGATVTVEHGVRVFRPLPADGHVIVNPGNRTPMSLNIYEPGVPVIPAPR